MKVLIFLNHPAHYYLFKYISKGLKHFGHEVHFVINNKDILEELLILENIPYTKLGQRHNRKQNALSILSHGTIELIRQDSNLLRYTRSIRPDIMMGTDISIAHIGKIRGIPSLIFNEDDFEINRIFCNLSYPFASHIISPEYCSVGKFSYKKIGYNGIQKMAYLNPKYYSPNKEAIRSLGFPIDRPYYVIRLVSLTAGHDIEGVHRGISKEILIKIIGKLEKKGKVFISSESISNEFEIYQIPIPLNKMHDVMAFAELFIGDRPHY